MIRLGLFALVGLLLVAPAAAADSSAAPAPEKAEKSEAAQIDDLFDRLAKTEDPDESAGIVKALEREWLKSGSDAADLLMSRALEALSSDDYSLALQLLDAVVATDPEWAEGWNKRATVRFYAGDSAGSAADVAQVLKRNPRHVGALAGLGMILEQSGRHDDALKVLERAQAIAPHYKPVQDAVERVKAEVAGQSL
jgi:tetratricopeptide (TPR) repeat protein